MFAIYHFVLAIVLICQFGSTLVRCLDIDLSSEPVSKEVEMNEGDPLKITCTNVWKTGIRGARNFDDPRFQDNRVFSFYTIDYNRSSEPTERRTVIYSKNSTLHGDTGLYQCTYTTSEQRTVTTNIFIFVKSNTSYFVEEVDSPMRSFVINRKFKEFGFPDDFIGFSCRVTSSSYDVQLFRDGKQLEPERDYKGDPKRDYVIVTNPSPGIYKCEVKINENVVANKQFNVTVINEEPAISIMRSIFTSVNGTDVRPEDILLEKEGWYLVAVPCDRYVHINVNHPFMFNCETVYSYSIDTQLNLEWTAPPVYYNRGPFTYYEERENSTSSNTRIRINQINALYTNKNYTGDFTCTLTHSKGGGIPVFTVSKTVTLMVHDPNFKGIELSRKESFYKRFVGESVQFVVSIEAYPHQPNITWFDREGNEIFGDGKKFSIDGSYLQTKLRITNLSSEDSGLYKIQAIAPDTEIKTLTFELDVWENKFIKAIDNVEAFYMQHDKAEIHCLFFPYPHQTIIWSFRADTDSQFHSFNTTVENLPSTSSNTSTTWEVQSSGIIMCTVCHDVNDCEKAERPIFMTDVKDGFGITSSNGKVMVNDTVKLVCAASIYLYTEQVKWLIESDSSHNLSDRITTNYTRTALSHEAILIIDPVRKIDDGTYICTSITNYGETRGQNYTLRVHDPVHPYFKETNMNRTVSHFNSGTVGTIVLTCYADGLPKPVISWWHEHNKIENYSNHTQTEACSVRFQSDNQELLIDNPNARCNGKYKCKIENRVGANEIYQTIVVSKIESSTSTRTILSIDFLMPSVVLILIVVLSSFAIYSLMKGRGLHGIFREMILDDFEVTAPDLLNPNSMITEQAELLPYEKIWEFPEEKLDIKELLGSGSFGGVSRALAMDLFGPNTIRQVAVKRPINPYAVEFVRPLIRELKTMDHLGKHLNVVNLLGACTKEIAKGKFIVIIEYCAFGNLRDYLRNNKSEFINQINTETGKIDLSIGSNRKKESIVNSQESINISNGSNDVDQSIKTASNENSETSSCEADDSKTSPTESYDFLEIAFNQAIAETKQEEHAIYGSDTSPSNHGEAADEKINTDENFLPLSTKNLLSWAFQVASGMEYLRQRKVLHGDLSIRNILLSKNNVVKISDFGLSKVLYNYDNYQKKGGNPLPVKWMAIESIRELIFSTQSDIWSFGIVLWELFELGETPYPGIKSVNVLEELEKGYRMAQPKYATRELHATMMQCWNEEPNSRPSFSVLIDQIGSLMDQEEKMKLENLNIPHKLENEKLREDGKKDFLPTMSSPNHDFIASRIIDGRQIYSD